MRFSYGKYLTLLQHKYADNLLKCFNFSDARPVTCPTDPKLSLAGSPPQVDLELQKEYRRYVQENIRDSERQAKALADMEKEKVKAEQDRMRDTQAKAARIVDAQFRETGLGGISSLARMGGSSSVGVASDAARQYIEAQKQTRFQEEMVKLMRANKGVATSVA